MRSLEQLKSGFNLPYRLFNKFIIRLKSYVQRRKLFKDFKKDYEMFTNLGNERFQLKWENRYPCLYDKTSTTGFDRHYIFHPAWAIRKIAEINPQLHIDIASTIQFSTLLSAFIDARFYDYRVVDFNLKGFKSGFADLTKLNFENNSIKSLSCMHVVEHIGLGRYGDEMDPDGDLKAVAELKRVLAPGGSLLFVVPVGNPRIMFNAHRIYSYDMVLDMFPELNLREFALIPDNAIDDGWITNPSKELTDSQKYGCGCFWFTK